MDNFEAIRALASEPRLTIMTILNQNGPLKASSISAYLEMDMSPSRLSNHLKLLKTAGLVSVDTRFDKPIYSLDRKAVDGVLHLVSKMLN